MAAPSDKNDNRMKLKSVIIGNYLVGKSSLLVKMTDGYFPAEYFPSVFDNFLISFDTREGYSVDLSLVDSPAGEEFDRLRPLSYPETNVFLISFSIDSRESFANVERKWWPEAIKFCPDVPRILLGTKSDLRGDSKTIERLKEEKKTFVSPDEAQEMATKIGAVEFIEISGSFFVLLDQSQLLHLSKHF
eukprot:TRINITY_DN7316_c0_g1_i1.p1 TRINITY_DN7316_c0_g1~~TRINITY_DN7316_c0_g1_i1.p1  ORF type:complete len:213 (+),score=20.52 TRINITY_DN7316_c0_g1_i1:73-639(+)